MLKQLLSEMGKFANCLLPRATDNLLCHSRTAKRPKTPRFSQLVKQNKKTKPKVR